MLQRSGKRSTTIEYTDLCSSSMEWRGLGKVLAFIGPKLNTTEGKRFLFVKEMNYLLTL